MSAVRTGLQLYSLIVHRCGILSHFLACRKPLLWFTMLSVRAKSDTFDRGQLLRLSCGLDEPASLFHEFQTARGG